MSNNKTLDITNIVFYTLCLGLGSVLLWYVISLIHPLYAIDQDLGRFFRIVEDIEQSGFVSTFNTYSYTHPEFEFVSSHWLGGVLLARLKMLIGLKGLIIFKAILSSLSLFVVLYIAFKRALFREKVYRLAMLSIFVIPFVYMALERTHVRPEIFSYFFFAVIYLMLFRYKYFGSKYIWIIPAIMLVWINTHIYFVLGFVLLGAFFLDFAYDSYNNKKLSKELKTITIIGVLSVLVSLINPHFVDGLMYPLFVFQNYGYTIVENQTLFFLIPFNYHQEVIATILITNILLVISFFLNYKRIAVSDLVLGLVFLYLSQSAIRHVYVYVLAVLPILVYNLSAFLDSLDKEQIRYLKPLVQKTLLTLAVIMSVVGLYLAFDASRNISLSTDESFMGAADFVIENNINGNIFNNFDIGGYLIYRFYPERSVFVDNRPEAYPASFFEESYKPMQLSADTWNDKVEEFGITYIVFAITDNTPWGRAFINRIVFDEEWALVYFDKSTMVLLRRDIEEYADIINQHEKRIQ